MSNQQDDLITYNRMTESTVHRTIAVANWTYIHNRKGITTIKSLATNLISRKTAM